MEFKKHMEFKKPRHIGTENGLVASRGEGRAYEGGERVQVQLPFIQEISHRDVMYSMVTVVNNTYLKVTKTVDHKSS